MKKFLPESLLWKLAAIGLGLITGTAVIALMTQLNYLFYPVPESPDETSEIILGYLNNPVFLSGQLIAIFTGCFVAGAAIKMIFIYESIRTLFYTSFVLMLVGLIDLVTAPYPFWYWITALVLYIPGTVAGGAITQKVQQKTVNH